MKLKKKFEYFKKRHIKTAFKGAMVKIKELNVQKPEHTKYVTEHENYTL